MKKIFQSLLFISAVSSLLSCTEKLDIAAPYKNITVVYGLLNRADTAHYIRIQKAFMDENQSAIDLAKVADSSFYNALEVVVKEILPSGALKDTFHLSKVELTLEGYAKEAGAFFNSPHYAYKFKHILDTNNQYRVVITNTQTGNVDSAVTPIITNMGPNFTQFGVIEWQRSSVSFTKVYRENGDLDESSYTVIIPPNVGVAELILRFHWTDSNVVTKTAVKRHADFAQFAQKFGSFTPSPTLSNRFDLTTQNKNIYDFLKGTMGLPASADQYRYMDSCDMLLYVAGIEYARYKDLNTNKGGITANEIRPLYTNVKGKDVLGLFSTRSFIQKLNMAIGSDTRDSLRSNSITRDLNIRFY
jgi:hypothetical protein